MTFTGLLKQLLLIALMIAGVYSLSFGDNSAKATYGLLSETYEGVNFDSVISTDTDRGFLGTWGGQWATFWADGVNYTEGSTGYGLNTWPGGGWGAFYINFGTSAYKMDRNFNAYAGGTIEFDIKLDKVTYVTSPSDVHVNFEWNCSTSAAFPVKGVQDDMTLVSYIADNGDWQHCSIPFADIKDTNFNGTSTTWYFVNDPVENGIKHACYMALFMNTSSRQFWIDNLVWKSTTTGSMNVVVRKISDNSTVTGSSFTWTGVTPGSTRWKTANEYIELKTDYYHSSWGIQIYTDNKAANANPQYTGTGDPVGLVNTSTTTKTLPMAWRCVDITTTSVSIQQGAPSYPGRLWVSELGDQYPCFNWMVDKSSNTFTNSADAQTVWDKRGIQHGEATWGGAKSPNYIYIAADFGSAVTPATYRTGKLTVELFHD